MKFGRLLLVGVFVVMSAAIAKADGLPDPHIIINNAGDPDCSETVICFSANSAAAPLVLTFFDNTVQFLYTGTDPLSALYLELEGDAIKPGIYDCSGDVFLGPCFGYFPPADPGGLELAANVLITHNELMNVTVTPEPSSLLLLATGIVALLGFRKKFRFSATQA
jgi:hypothetical protein